MTPQFQALGPAQREAILKALNEDAEKLLADYGSSAQDPELQQLEEEMRNCNEIFAQLSAKTTGAGRNKITYFNR